VQVTAPNAEIEGRLAYVAVVFPQVGDNKVAFCIVPEMAGDPDFGQRKNCRVNYRCDDGQTRAVTVQEGEIARLSCEAYESNILRPQPVFLNTPVMLTTTPEVLELLLAHGADVHPGNDPDQLIQALACNRDTIAIFNVLPARDITINTPPKQAPTVLQCAVITHRPDFETFLLTMVYPSTYGIPKGALRCSMRLTGRPFDRSYSTAATSTPSISKIRPRYRPRVLRAGLARLACCKFSSMSGAIESQRLG
jgi:hypothetical protein